MSDEELQSIDRADLVEAARRIFDEELASREAPAPAPVHREMIPAPDEAVEQDWLDDAAEAFSSYARPGSTDPSEGSVDARDALEAAQIPCHLELCEEPDAEQQYRYRWRVLVPGKLIHRAASVLDRDLFNQQFESELRTHLEMLSDDELRVMEPRYAFCGLYDRLERINRAYDEELARRKRDR
jgi:hypothetical protein